MLNFSVCVGGGGVGVGRGLFFVVVFNAFFEFKAKHQIIFLANQTEFGRIFLSTTFLTRIFHVAY